MMPFEGLLDTRKLGRFYELPAGVSPVNQNFAGGSSQFATSVQKLQAKEELAFVSTE
jgi:hypothetical protein